MPSGEITVSDKSQIHEAECEMQDLSGKSLPQIFSVDNLIWGKLSGCKWWPAIVINPSVCGHSSSKVGHTWVFWFGDHKISEISNHKIVNFMSCFYNMSKLPPSKLWLKAITEVLEILTSTTNMSFSSSEDLFKWARNGFPNIEMKADVINSSLSSFILKYLNRIENQTDEDHSDEEDSKDLDTFYEKLKSGTLKLEEHPFFFGGLCLSCKEHLKETAFAVGSDAKNICCIICSKPGFLIICDNINCPRSYCRKCIVCYLGCAAAEQIIEISPWFCFFCSSNETNNCLLKTRKDWEEKLMALFTIENSSVNEIQLSDFTTKQPITVLSLFDGISTGKLVLDSLNISINKYYSSEIDEDAINVSKLHHKDIVYLGDVCNLTETVIESFGHIDLVIGGSPCNDLSLVNPARKGLYDFTGTGSLFFDFFHILNILKRRNPNVLYLFENVAAMLQRDKTIISSFLMHEPALIDAKYFSPQARARYFWGNIPGLHSLPSFWNSLPNNEIKESVLNDCILPNVGRKAVVEKIKTVTTQRNSLIQEQCSVMPVIMNGEPDVLWVTELEKIFGFPLHYTDTGNLGIAKRRELLGRAWSVPVIKTILQPLRNFFELKNGS